MGLRDTAVSLIAFADRFTKAQGLQDTVVYYASAGVAGDGTRQYVLPGVPIQAIVIRKQQLVKTMTGETVMSHSYIGFLQPMVISELDKIVLSDGTTGQILNTEGFMDSGTSHPMLTEVYLG
jgi:hypothetical protein